MLCVTGVISFQKGVSDKCHVDAGIPVASTQPVNDISHLVRRVKRPADVVDEEVGKRLKGPDASVESVHVNGNGTVEQPVSDGASDVSMKDGSVF